jgi:ketosteroid isomerase-like protein
MAGKSWMLSLTLPFLLGAPHAHAESGADRAMFQALFNAWTQAFNQKKYPEVCELFSVSIAADYQGAPKKDYTAMCEGFRRIFAEADTVYHNAFQIHEIHRSHELATVRITWYLHVTRKDMPTVSVQEEGLDVLRRQADGKWRIVNFIAYPVPSRE